MSDIHPVFHVSQLRKCLRVPEVEHVPVETLDLQPDLQYQEVPVKILDTVTKRKRNSEVRICRVQWSRHGVEEDMWEREDALKREFPHLFRTQPNLEDEIQFKWGRFVTSVNFTPINHSLKTILKLCKNLLELIFFPSKNILFQPTTSFVHLSFHQYINFSLKYP